MVTEETKSSQPTTNSSSTTNQPKPSSSTTTTTTTTINPKVKVHLVAVGSAPILKKNKFLMKRTDNFGVAISFLRKRLKLDIITSTTSNNTTVGNTTVKTGSTNTGSNNAASLFLYINSAFVPSPTEQIGDLYDCFGMREELVIHYSLQEAWG